MLGGLLIGEAEAAEPYLITDTCDYAPGSVDYPNFPVIHTEGKGTRPDEEKRNRQIDPVPDAKGIIYLQTFSVQDQLSREALCLLSHRQGPVLPGKVGLHIRQHFDSVGSKHFPGTDSAVNPAVSSASGYFISDRGYDSARTITDLDLSLMDMRCETGGPDYRVRTAQANALAVQ